MFTGIVQATGRIADISITGNGGFLKLNINGLNTGCINLGDSVSVNGACLTITQIEGDVASFDVSNETLSKCLIGSWRRGDTVNVELAITLQTPLGGHLVSGHVDGVGTMILREDGDEFSQMTFETCRSIGELVAVKGSVTIDGVSLTTNAVIDMPSESSQSNDELKTQFEVMLVPHTLENTTLGGLRDGGEVHIEVDQIARYVQRIINQNSK